MRTLTILILAFGFNACATFTEKFDRNHDIVMESDVERWEKDKTTYDAKGELKGHKYKVIVREKTCDKEFIKEKINQTPYYIKLDSDGNNLGAIKKPSKIITRERTAYVRGGCDNTTQDLDKIKDLNNKKLKAEFYGQKFKVVTGQYIKFPVSLAKTIKAHNKKKIRAKTGVERDELTEFSTMYVYYKGNKIKVYMTDTLVSSIVRATLYKNNQR